MTSNFPLFNFTSTISWLTTQYPGPSPYWWYFLDLHPEQSSLHIIDSCPMSINENFKGKQPQNRDLWDHMNSLFSPSNTTELQYVPHATHCSEKQSYQHPNLSQIHTSKCYTQINPYSPGVVSPVTRMQPGIGSIMGSSQKPHRTPVSNVTVALHQW